MIKDALLAEYDHEMATTRKLLERLPDAHLAWTPHERSRSLGALATHLARLASWTDIVLNTSSFDLAEVGSRPADLTSRTDVLQAFDDARGRARAIMDKGDGEYTALFTLKRDGHEMFSMPRIAAFRSFVLSHIIHHRGQLSVYLRLQGVPVPAIYGPSADEG